jgi:hypothetical protein
VSSYDPLKPDDEGQPQSCFLWAGVVLVICLAAGTYAVYRLAQKPPDTTAVTASSGRLTLQDDDGGNLTVVDLRQKPELWYRVTLEDAPVGSKLALSCDWIDPNGNVAHHNHYQTREIDRTVWPTHARYQLTPNSPTGTWTVKLSLDGRVLHAMTFELRN